MVIFTLLAVLFASVPQIRDPLRSGLGFEIVTRTTQLIGQAYPIMIIVFLGSELTAMRTQALNRQLSMCTHVTVAFFKILILPGLGLIIIKFFLY